MDFTGSGFSTRARLNTTFKLDKTLSVQLQGFYRGAQKSANQNTQDMYALNFGASKTIWKGDGTISFNIQDIFNTRSREVFSFNSDYTRRNYMQWQPRQFSISLTYRFKQGEKIEQPKKKKKISIPMKQVTTNKVVPCNSKIKIPKIVFRDFFICLLYRFRLGVFVLLCFINSSSQITGRKPVVSFVIKISIPFSSQYFFPVKSLSR